MHPDATGLRADTVTVAANNAAETLHAHMRGKLRLVSLGAIDGRTTAAKRARELVSSMEADLGGADRLSEGFASRFSVLR